MYTKTAVIAVHVLCNDAVHMGVPMCIIAVRVLSYRIERWDTDTVEEFLMEKLVSS